MLIFINIMYLMCFMVMLLVSNESVWMCFVKRNINIIMVIKWKINGMIWLYRKMIKVIVVLIRELLIFGKNFEWENW